VTPRNLALKKKLAAQAWEDHLADCISTEVLSSSNKEKRIALIERVIEIAHVR